MRRAVTAPVKVGKAPATVAVAAEVAEVDVVDAARAQTEVSARIARREPVLIRKQQPWVPKAMAMPMPTKDNANRAMTPSVSRAKHVKHAKAVARAMQNVVVNVASVVAAAATANARRAQTTPMQTAMSNAMFNVTPSAMPDATKAARHAKHAPLTRPTHRQKPTHC